MSAFRRAWARLRHRLGCQACAAGTHLHVPLPEDPLHHLWLPPGWRKAR